MTEIRLGRDLALPLDFASEANAILATRGAGKSYTSAVLTEELHAAGIQTVAVDPAGVYWGLRSSASGKGDGLPFYVLGGEHGDLPLEPTAGAFVADLIVDSGHSFVLDLSHFESKADSTRFVTAFAERLYYRKGKAEARTTLHLVVDEADEFAPQKPMREETKMLHNVERLVKRGRSRGIGVTLITQRSQAINKSVLDLIETLVVMRMLSPRSRDAVKLWIDARDLRDESGVIESLSSLPTGTAWVWSPLRGVLKRVAVRRIRTFDSYETPKPGEVREQPSRRAELDLADLGEQMQATVERSKENDPVALRKQIAELRRELASRPTETREVPVEKVVEVPVLSETDLARLDAIFENYRHVADTVSRAAAELDARHEDLFSKLVSARGKTRLAGAGIEIAPKEQARPRPTPAQPAPDHERGNGNGSLDTGARRLLETLARHHPMRLPPGQLALLAGRKARGGAWNTSMRRLRDGGYVREDAGLLALTDLGVEETGADALEPISTQEVIDHWRRALPAGPCSLFDLLVREHPNGLSPEQAAELLGRQPRGGAWNTAVSTLVRNGLAEKTGGILRASDSLFDLAA